MQNFYNIVRQNQAKRQNKNKYQEAGGSSIINKDPEEGSENVRSWKAEAQLEMVVGEDIWPPALEEMKE